MALATRWLHVVAAMMWIGGMLFIALVLMPATRRLEDAALRARLIHTIGLRFRTVGWIAIAVLVATGVGNLWHDPALLATVRLRVKLGLVALSIVLSAVHDFDVGPRAGAPGADPVLRIRASWLARINVLVVLLIVLLGASLED